MPVVKVAIWIDVPIEFCFDIARNISLHPRSVPHTKERAVAGVTEGLIQEGETVTWEAIHLGVRQTLTARIISMNPPYEFIDRMEEGAFHSLIHVHLFEEQNEGTLMTDILQFESPFGPVGRIFNRLFLKKYMTNFLVGRSENLKEIAEDEYSRTGKPRI
ncbi:SRPBCC family protein [Halobacillus sp. K22]|uniref:SRPBCC family protein n=1 Tax=Halobacillus sp. K22 TaxID=3457431 RepID=UPI003FCD42AD